MSNKSIILFFVVINIALYIAIVILSGDPFWIINTAEWNGRARIIAVLVLGGLNCMAIMAVDEVAKEKKELDKPED